METKIPAEGVSTHDLDLLGEVAGKLSDERLAAGVRALQSQIASGTDVVMLGVGSELSPQDAAKMLRVSRTFLIKLMDKGELEFHYVGKHRRLKMDAVRELKQRLHAATRRSAEEFAHIDRLEAQAVAEM